MDILSNMEWAIKCSPERTPVRGNYIETGDDAADKAYEDELLAEIDSGNEWAWCVIEVTASVEIGGVTIESDPEYLGCSSYSSESDFIQEGGYYEDMKAITRDNLMDKIAKIREGLL